MLSFPNINGVRVATLDDLPRIAIVAAAAFFWSPTFRFQRPRYKEFPTDTLHSYLSEYEATIRNPAYVVLVAEDLLEADEAEHVYEALQSAYQPSRPREIGIVGVCSILLKPESFYVGLLQPASYSGSRPEQTIRYMTRDQCVEALGVYESITGPPKLEYLANKMRLSTLAVNPVYWRRGHATRLVSFCTKLADLDGAVMGVSATPQGAKVMIKAGFEECETVHIKRLAMHDERERENPPNAADVILWIGVRPPCSRSPSTEIASGSESPTESQQAS